MPLVIVQHDPTLSDETLAAVKQLVKRSAAAALDCSATDPDGNGALVPDEINVRFWPYGPHDDQEFTLDIWPIAMGYPTRADASLQGRSEQICKDLCASEVLPAGSRIGVFPIAPPAGWAEGIVGA
jgi:hypothetical protein